jgi:hypothetical protein
MQNGFYESFNGRMRDELLNESLFRGLDHARETIARWVTDYNQRRPHSALGCIPPAAYAANLAAMRGRPGNPNQPGRPHIATRARPRKTRRGSNPRWIKVHWQVSWC